jgi:hypothetical protein
LWHVVAGNATQFAGNTTQLPGNATQLAGNNTSLAALNTHVAALRDALGRQASGGNNLTVADALWTKGIALSRAYAGDMQRLFKVRKRSHPVTVLELPQQRKAMLW